jgi:sodium transport system permease protein
MTPATVFTVVKKELVDHLRDRRTALMIFLLSIAMGPLMLVGLTFFVSSLEERAEKREVFVMGIEHAPEIANFLARQDITVKAPAADFRALIKNGTHDAVLVVGADFTEKFITSNAAVELVYDDTRQSSTSVSTGVLRRLLRGFNSEVSTQRLIARGVSPAILNAVEVRDTNLGTAAQRAAMLLLMIPWIALIVGVSGCMSVAIDMTAGERERGSLEPLLLNPVSRATIVLGKWGAVACYGVAIVVLILLGFALTLSLAPLPKLSNFITLSPVQYLGFAALLLPFAPAMGAVQMLIATYGRTFKEAQTYVSYLITAVSLVPAIAMFAQLKDETWQVFVPMLGQLMVLTRILRGEPVDAAHILVPLLVCIGITVVSIYLMTKLVQQEKIVFGRS